MPRQAQGAKTRTGAKTGSNLYVANDDDTVSEVTPAGVVSTFGFNNPAALAFHAGNLYVTNTGDNTVSDVTQTLTG